MEEWKRKLETTAITIMGFNRVRAVEFSNGTDNGSYYNGSYRDYYKHPFVHS